MNIKELDLLENKTAREKVISRTEVLDKVGDLLLLPNTEYATTEQVGIYYNVDIEAINAIINRHRDELESDGFKLFKKNNVVKLLNVQDEHLENIVGKSIVTLGNNEKINIPNRGLRLFSKRAILRVGMLLRDSEVAKEVRTRLLDIVHDTQEQSPEIIKNVVGEMTKEMEYQLKLGEAFANGDTQGVLVYATKITNLKNKRIEKLETTVNNITNHALTIIESRAVINRLVRAIAFKDYNGRVGIAFNDLYSKLNYKLGINIRNRNKKKDESLLNTLTEEETFETEKIVRSWAVEMGLDLDRLLKIAG